MTMPEPQAAPATDLELSLMSAELASGIPIPDACEASDLAIWRAGHARELALSPGELRAEIAAEEALLKSEAEHEPGPEAGYLADPKWLDWPEHRAYLESIGSPALLEVGPPAPEPEAVTGAWTHYPRSADARLAVELGREARADRAEYAAMAAGAVPVPEPEAWAGDIDECSPATAAEWLAAGPEDRHPYGSEPRIDPASISEQALYAEPGLPEPEPELEAEL